MPLDELREAMSNWAERMHRRAVDLGHVVTSCSNVFSPYPTRLERVKFGTPIEEVCKDDIPGLLLVLILKLNKEGLYKKDIFRAPGHQGNIRKLVYYLQAGRLVNFDRYSVYTIASVLKKFLSKLPGGIFGREGEEQLFRIIQMEDEVQQRASVQRIILSLPDCSQKLLVLIFGTLRLIATTSETYNTGMTSEALGVSIAPSFLQTCVSDGKEATMSDVLRFKVASKIMQFLIDNFGLGSLFGRENYEYYSRITGRVLKVDREWVFSVCFPPQRTLSLSEDVQILSDQADARSCLTLVSIAQARSAQLSRSLTNIPQNTALENTARLSASLEENAFAAIFAKCTPRAVAIATAERILMEELRLSNRNAQSTRSLSFLPEVHERQVERMRARSEWFLSPVLNDRQAAFADEFGPAPAFAPRGFMEEAGLGAAGFSASAESVQVRPFIRASEWPQLAQQPLAKDEGGQQPIAKDEEAGQAIVKDEEAEQAIGKEEDIQQPIAKDEDAAAEKDKGAKKAVKKTGPAAKPKKAKKVAAMAE